MNLGGIYTDPFHSPITVGANIFGLGAPWYGGIRINAWSKDLPEAFLCIGNDDGVHWWTLKGSFSDVKTGAIDMDFTPKAPGVGKLKCSYATGALSFLDGDGKVANTWSRLKPTDAFALEAQTKHAAFNDVNGLYVDPSTFKDGSFSGIRVVSDRLGKVIRDEICVIGTDDGESFWCIEGGKFTDKSAGMVKFGSYIGTCHNGSIKFEDGKEWVKMVPQSDLHTLPKEREAKL